MDFFVVPTATFRVLSVLVILRNDRSRIVHFNVAEHPTAEWTAQQVVEAFPWDEAPRFLMRDRDGIHGAVFSSRVKRLGMEEVKSAPRSPWQDPHVERVIGSIRRELLDRVIVLGERHLLSLLKECVAHLNTSRTHPSLGKDSPNGRDVQGPELGDVVTRRTAGRCRGRSSATW